MATAPPRSDGTQRLAQFLASTGLGSRRSCEGLVRAGRVEVNGEVVQLPGPRVHPEKDVVQCDGERVRPPRRWLYLMMNKPAGLVTTRSDERGRATVDELLGRLRGRVVPVGRLDRATEGLLLFTNNGDLAHRLLHPKFRQPRTYLAWVTPSPTKLHMEEIERGGIAIGSGERSGTAEARILSRKGTTARVRITLREGKYREVRRIFKALDLRVLVLRRVAYAGMRLDELPTGALRPLVPEEIAELARRTGLAL